MGRKFRSTEVSGYVRIPDSGGQHMHLNVFCVTCNGVNRHYSDCKKKETYPISATAEAPKKGSSKRKWEIFKKQFVYSRPVGWWNYSGWDYWWKNKNKIK